MREFQHRVRMRVRALAPSVLLTTVALAGTGMAVSQGVAATTPTPVVTPSPIVLMPPTPAPTPPASSSFITGLTPSHVLSIGGELVFVSGTNLSNAVKLEVDGIPVDFTIEDDGRLSFITPDHAVGTVQVRLFARDGIASDSGTADDLTYGYLVEAPSISQITPNSGPLAGGNTVNIKGQNFAAAQSVVFGADAVATNLKIASDSELTVTAPAGAAAGTVHVTIIGASGNAPPRGSDEYTYVAGPVAPAVGTITPDHGSADGGTVITLTGKGFTGVTGVVFAPNYGSGTNLNVISDTKLEITSPGGSPGSSAGLRLVGPAGTTLTGATFKYDYYVGPTGTLSPDHGKAGDTATITGTNLTGGLAVFGGRPLDAIGSDTTLTFTIPSGFTGTQYVSVATHGGKTGATVGTFTYDPIVTPTPTPTPVVKLPVITGLSPATGLAYIGGITQLSGSNLVNVKSVRIGARSAQFVRVGGKLIVFAPGQKPGKYPVIVTTSAGMSQPAIFTYTALV